MEWLLKRRDVGKRKLSGDSGKRGHQDLLNREPKPLRGARYLEELGESLVPCTILEDIFETGAWSCVASFLACCGVRELRSCQPPCPGLRIRRLELSPHPGAAYLGTLHKLKKLRSVNVE